MLFRSALATSRALSIAVLGLVAAACTTLRVGNDFDRDTNFSAYHTFAWMPREHHGTQNPLVSQRARDAIQAELVQKGFAYLADAATADLVVDFTIGAHDRTDVRSYPAPFAGPWNWERSGWWGYPYWGSEVDVRQYREGTLSIDVFDGHTHKAIWHGWAKKELSQADIDRSEAPIRAAVLAVLEKFPPK